MEAWLKFQAPGVSIPIGLGIGRLVFGALNKVEWVFMLGIMISIAYSGGWKSLVNPLVLILLLILLLQSFLMLPRLDARAQAYINGSIPPASRLHFYYVGMELVKVTSLIVIGLTLL